MVDPKTVGFLTSAGIGLAVLTACLILFEILRRALPDVYYYRNRAKYHADLADYNGRPMGTAPLPGAFWPAAVLKQDDKHILETHGLDTGLFLRYLSTQVRTFTVIAIVTAIALVPIYATGSNKSLPEDDDEHTVGIQIITLSNVATRHARLVGVFVIDMLVIAFICYMLYRDMAYYTHVRRRYRASLNPANYAVAILDLPSELQQESALNTMFDALFPGDVEASYIVRDAGRLTTLKNNYSNAYTKHEAELHDKDVDPSGHTDAGGPSLVAKSPFGSKESPEEHWAKMEQEAYDEAVQARADLDTNAPRTTAAFVVFRRKEVATVAATTTVAFNGMKIVPAPEPRDVFWDRLHVTRKTAKARLYISLVLAVLMAVLWVFPVTAIQSLSNFEELAKQDRLQFLADFQNSAPGFVKFLEGFLPAVLLLVLNILVPVFMRLILSRSRAYSRAVLDAMVTRYLYVFHTITTFLANILIGSVLGAINSILKDPNFSDIVAMLSNTVPGLATFFITYIALNSGIGCGVGLLSPPRVLFRPFIMKGVRTERQRRKANTAHATTPMFKDYATTGLHVLIGTVYCTVAPLCALVVAIAMAVKYVTLKHVYLYADRREYQGGGISFQKAWEHSFFSLFMHQLILGGLFSLKKRPSLAVLEFLSLIVTISYFVYLRRKFYKVARHGDLMFTHDEVDRHGRVDQIPDHYAQLYRHPGLDDVKNSVKMEDVDTSGHELPA